MKIIDLLNKIAKGEEPPKKIILKNELYILKKWENIEETDYYCESTGNVLGDIYLTSLNEEVEIIEDELIYFSKEENQALKNIIKKISIPAKENYNDYYEDTPKENKKIEKLDLEELNEEHTLYGVNAIIVHKINEIIDKINGEK